MMVRKTATYIQGVDQTQLKLLYGNLLGTIFVAKFLPFGTNEGVPEYYTDLAKNLPDDSFGSKVALVALNALAENQHRTQVQEQRRAHFMIQNSLLQQRRLKLHMQEQASEIKAKQAEANLANCLSQQYQRPAPTGMMNVPMVYGSAMQTQPAPTGMMNVPMVYGSATGFPSEQPATANAMMPMLNQYMRSNLDLFQVQQESNQTAAALQQTLHAMRVHEHQAQAIMGQRGQKVKSSIKTIVREAENSSEDAEDDEDSSEE